MNRWYLEISGTNLAYTVCINDIVIFSDRWQISRSDGCPINQWLVPGVNKLQVNLGVGLGKSEPDAQPACSIRIKEVDLENPDAPQSVVAEFVSVFTDTGIGLPFNKVVEFVAPDIEPSRWESGEVFDSENPNLTGLNEFLFRVQTQLVNKNLDAILETMQIKSKEMAFAYGVPMEERLQDQREFFLEMFAIPEWEMEPFDPMMVFTQVEGDGRLLKVTDKLGGPVLRTKDFEDGSNFGFKFYFCKKDGCWEVAR